MLFAQVRGIATVNGYSSFFPDGWALDEPASPGYPAAVRDWARRNGIEAIYVGWSRVPGVGCRACRGRAGARSK